MIDDEIGQQLVKLASKNVLSYLSEEKKRPEVKRKEEEPTAIRKRRKMSENYRTNDDHCKSSVKLPVND